MRRPIAAAWCGIVQAGDAHMLGVSVGTILQEALWFLQFCKSILRDDRKHIHLCICFLCRHLSRPRKYNSFGFRDEG